MPRRSKPPVFLECVPTPKDVVEKIRQILPSADVKLHRVESCRWRCRRTLRGATWRHRKDPSRILILHPSTKRVGGWQVSEFDDRGAVRDGGVHPTCDDALANINSDYLKGIWDPRKWRLDTFE